MNEEFGFIPLIPGGGSALVVGNAGAGLVKWLSHRFLDLTIADWDHERLRRLSPAESSALHLCPFVPGQPDFGGAHFEQIVVLWAQPFLGDPQAWTADLFARLSPRGRLVVVDLADRPMSPGQELTAEALDLELEIAAAAAGSVQPRSTPDRMLEHLAAAGVNYLKQPVFTDPDLLADSAHWLCTLELLQTKLNAPAIRPELRRRLQSKCRRLAEKSAAVPPQTPPFYMASGVKRLTSVVPLPEVPDESVALAETARDVNYLASPRLPDPVERLLVNGPGALKNQELMALAVGAAGENPPTLNAEDLARRILAEYGSKAIAEERNPGRLAQVMGIPIPVACQVVAVFELGRRFFREPSDQEPVIRSPDDAFAFLRDMASLKKEHLRGLYLNVQSRMIHDEVISIGTLSRSVVHPREVFAPALEHSADSVILAHNHPSGDLTPSDMDVVVTRQIAQAGMIMGIELVDHLIIGPSGYVSLKQKGLF